MLKLISFYRSVWMGVAWGLVATCFLAYASVLIQKMGTAGYFVNADYQAGFINGAGFGFAFLLAFTMGLTVYEAAIKTNMKKKD